MSDQLRPYTANSLKFILTPSPASLQKFPVLWHHILCPRLLLLPSCYHISFFPSISSLVFIPLCTLLSKLRMKFAFSHVKKRLRLSFLVLAPILRTLSLSQVSYHRPFLNKDNSLPGCRPTVKKIGFFLLCYYHRRKPKHKNYVDWWKLPVCYLAEQGLELNCFDLNPVHFLLSSYLRNICEILQCLVFWHIYWVCVQLKALF